MELKFQYGIWKMPEWSRRFQEWNGTQSSIPIPYEILCIVFTKKKISGYRVVINNFVTEVFNFNIYTYYLLTNCGTLVE